MEERYAHFVRGEEIFLEGVRPDATSRTTGLQAVSQSVTAVCVQLFLTFLLGLAAVCPLGLFTQAQKRIRLGKCRACALQAEAVAHAGHAGAGRCRAGRVRRAAVRVHDARLRVGERAVERRARAGGGGRRWCGNGGRDGRRYMLLGVDRLQVRY